MRRQTVTQGAIILVVTGFITQILSGILNQIVITRFLGEDGVNIYVLILPTLMLFSTLASTGLPAAVNVLISRSHLSKKKILSTAFVMAIFFSLISGIILLVIARPLAFTFLKDERTYLPLLAMIPLLFCLAFSSVLKAYFQGLQNMATFSVAVLVEQIVRVIASAYFIGIMLPRGLLYGVIGVIAARIVSELIAGGILLGVLMKHVNFKSVAPVLGHFKTINQIAVLATGNQLGIALVGFLEPIIVMQALFRIGYPRELSRKLYGAVSGYTMPLLLMPSFITGGILQAMTPSISQAYARGDLPRIHHHLNVIIKISFFIGSIYTVLMALFPAEIMNLVFGTATGSEYLSLMAPFFIFLILQPTFTAFLQGVGGGKVAMTSTFISSAIKISLMIALLPILRLNIEGLVIAILTHSVIVTVWHYYLLKKRIGYRINIPQILNGLLIFIILARCSS